MYYSGYTEEHLRPGHALLVRKLAEPGFEKLCVYKKYANKKFLKVAFPLDVRAEHTVAETQFGAQKRVTHTNTSWEAAKFETSMHRYVLVSEPGFGVALVNDSIHGFDTTRDAVQRFALHRVTGLAELAAGDDDA